MGEQPVQYQDQIQYAQEPVQYIQQTQPAVETCDLHLNTSDNVHW